MATIKVVTPEEMHDAISAAVEPLLRKMELIEKYCFRYVGNREAELITGLAEATLKNHREEEGSLIIYHRVGKRSGKVVYDVLSLFAFMESRRIKHLHGKDS